MPEPHVFLSSLAPSAAANALRRCCGAERWVTAMLKEMPFASTEQLLSTAERIWSGLAREDYLEAFSHHPQLGSDGSPDGQQLENSRDLSKQEQAGIASGEERTLLRLRDANRAYRERFGFIFIACATGKTADEVLESLSLRLGHEPARELFIAAAEQAKITRLRLLGLCA